jgi:hypothetical protein
MAESTQPPGVMVSSTFYDLREVRDDLRRFLQDELGYRPLLSEHRSFPLNPDASTIDNCRERVERDADILVLVIGGRYGSIDDQTSKSVTNLEYLSARRKGIPVYAFVEQGIVALVPIWKSNPSADFSARVDTPKLFEFLEIVRSVDKVWTQEFKNASEIIDALRIQFAYQHRDGLSLQRRILQTGDHYWLKDLRGEALRIALEKPRGWEYLLFAQALIDFVNKHHRLLRRIQTRIPIGLGEDVNEPLTWLRARFADGLRMPQALAALISGTLPAALGPPGVPGDAEKIVFVAATFGDIYLDALQWCARVRAANIEPRFGQLSMIASGMVDDLIQQIADFGPYVMKTWEEALAAPETGTPRVVNMTLTISVSPTVIEEFSAEAARLRSQLG